MSATIERSLYIGITKTRFDIYDDVKLKLTLGDTVQGTIIDMDDESIVLDTKQGRVTILCNEIEDYIA